MKKMKGKLFTVLCSFVLALGVGVTFSACDTADTSEGTKKVTFNVVSVYQKEQDNRLTLALVDGTVTPDGLKLTITNNTEQTLTYGMEFKVEYQSDGMWYVGEGNYYFNSLAAVLASGETNQFSVNFPDTLKNGHYRVLKTFSIDGENVTYDVEFDIE